MRLTLPMRSADTASRRTTRALGVAGHRLHRVAAQIGEHAEQLVGVGVHLEGRLDGIDELDAFADVEQAVHVLDQLAQPHPAREGGGSCVRP